MILVGGRDDNFSDPPDVTDTEEKDVELLMDSLYCVQNKVLVDAAEEAVDVVTEITEDEGEGDLVSTDMVG